VGGGALVTRPASLRRTRGAPWVRRALCAVLLGTVACEHPGPGAVRTPADAGPYDPALPRQLTFSAGDDGTPSVTGSVLVFTRQGSAYPNPLYTIAGREACLAFLPVEGGTLLRTLCPHDLIVPADTFIHAWFEPSLSPDGTRIAFDWQRGPDVGPLGFADIHLMVAAVDRPADTLQTRVVINYAEDGYYPRRASLAGRITWVGAERLRFLATFERIFKVKDGGAERVTDTLFEPLALMELDVASGATSVVPGGDSVVAYANAPDGKVWVVREPDPAAVLLLDPATGTRTGVGRFSSPAVDLVAVAGSLVAAVSPAYDPGAGLPLPVVRGGMALELMDLASGGVTTMPGLPGPIRRLAAASGRRFVAEAERYLRPFGWPADLWLLEAP
jgi:hypothetical protein